MGDCVFGAALGGGEGVVVGVAIDAGEPVVVGRWRGPLVDPAQPVSMQPYHQAAETPGVVPADVIRAATMVSSELASALVQQALDDERPSSAIVVTSNAHIPSSLDKILGSHILLHASEGELLRSCLREAFAAEGIDVQTIRVGKLTGADDPDVRARLTQLGKSVGKPWTQPEKHATLAAWRVLAGGDVREAFAG